jgi:trehalose 6-phosphate phosphatase
MMRGNALRSGTPDEPGPPADIPGLWPDLQRAHRPLLGLDYDGTLAPLRIERMEARPLPGVTAVLGVIRDHGATAVAIVSGRSLAELALLLDVPGLTLVGAHGREFAWPDGTHERLQPTAHQRSCLDEAEAAAGGLADAGRIERKIASVAVHVRGLPADEGRALCAAVADRWSRAACADLECRKFNGGIELRALAADKGFAIGRVAERIEPDMAVYLGDDETDEDAFRALRAMTCGYAIGVGSERSPSLAHGWLAGPEQVLEFLEWWCHVRGCQS